MIFEETVVALSEAKWHERHTYCHQLEDQAAQALRDLKDFCSKVAETQSANDRALQELQREVGQLSAAANQQNLTALLIEPDGGLERSLPAKAQSKRKKLSTGRALVQAPNDQLRTAVERARGRGNRFNAARIEVWLKELEQALKVGVHAAINRALAGLAAELTK